MKKHDFKKTYFVKKARFSRKKFCQKVDFEKSFAHKKSRSDSIYPVKCANFAFYVHFQKAQFRGKIFFTEIDFEKKIFSKKNGFE